MKGKAFWLTLVAVAALGLALFAAPTLARPATPSTPPAVSGDGASLPEWCHGGAGSEAGGAGVFDPVTLSRIAAFLGLTPQELTTRLGQGQTLAAIATEQGKTAAGLVETILAPDKDHLAVAVKYGYLTQAAADALYAARAQALSYQLNVATLTYTPGYAPGLGGRAPGWGGMGGGMMGGGMMGGGMMGGGMMGGSGRGMMGGGGW